LVVDLYQRDEAVDECGYDGGAANDEIHEEEQTEKECKLTAENEDGESG